MPSSRKRVEFVRRTKTTHRCQGCPKTIAKGKPATVLVEEGYDEDGEYWKRLTYFHNVPCYYVYLGVVR